MSGNNKVVSLASRRQLSNLSSKRDLVLSVEQLHVKMCDLFSEQTTHNQQALLESLALNIPHVIECALSYDYAQGNSKSLTALTKTFSLLAVFGADEKFSFEHVTLIHTTTP
jgi:hypothetical protein